jgi:hypothetical protein
MSLNKATVTKININQNIMIKSMLGISKYCHTSELLRVLKLYDINCLIVFLKLSFIRNLKNNILTYKIFSFLFTNINLVNLKSKSFIIDYKNICSLLNLDHNYLINNINDVYLNYKKEYFNSDTDDIVFNLIKSALLLKDKNDRLYSLNLILKF